MGRTVQSYHNKNTIKKRNYKSRGGERSAISRLLGEEVRQITEEYLEGDRQEALVKLAVVLNQSRMNKLKPFLKKSIHSYVKHFRKDFEGSIEIKNCVYDMFKDFDMTDFVKREWQYKPYYIHAVDYEKLQFERKYPVHIANYNYSEPIYKLSNNIDYNPKELKRAKTKEQIKNDVKFYLSSNENIVFAKLINLKYRPSDLRMLKQKTKGYSDEEKQFAVYDNYLYNRSLSISMYVLLDGNPDKALPFIRYDNDPAPHSNLYIGNDNRRDIYGKEARGPHFHFQSEDDSLLCLRKFKGEDGKTKYKTGRCNAIDCSHLKKYLLELDSLTPKQVCNLAKQGLDYGMPFLQLKLTEKKIGTSAEHLFFNFIKDKTDEEIHYLDEFAIWLTQSKNDKVYHNGKSFDKLIRDLDVLDRISILMDSANNPEQRKIYSQLEIVIADSVMDVICNNSSKYIVKDQAPKYTIETDLLNEEKTSL